MTRFLPAEDYLPSGRYELLPFRFERLEGERVLLSNMAGEALTVSSADLTTLVNGDLDRSGALFSRLRANHFLRQPEDRAALELLALKLRTRYARLRDFTSLHLFVVTLRCDHACRYCQVSRQSADRASFDMSRATADRAIDLLFRSPNQALKVEFQGGEPLLNFDLIRYVVLSITERNRQHKRDIQFVITTTLSLISDDTLAFCREHRIVLSASLDGPEDLHNANRPRPGADSHARFVAGLEKARDVLGPEAISALMTTTAASLQRGPGIVDEYLRLGFHGIFLRHLSPYGFALKTKSYQGYDTARWLEFYEETLTYIIDLNRSGVRFTEQHAAIILRKMFSCHDPGYVDLMNPSGAGIAAIVFNYDGGVFASDESRMLMEMGDDTFRLGSVHEHGYDEIFSAPALLSALEDSFTLSAPMCADCACEPWCGADPVYHHARHGDPLGRKAESGFCQRMKGMTRIFVKAMEDPFVAALFRRWALSC